MAKRTGLGLYVHIPFCRRKCAYCDFVSGPAPRAVQTAYMEALADEFTHRASGLPVPFETIYAGGGSPSSLALEEWRGLAALLAREGTVECTVEMNPSQVTAEKLAVAEGIVTRISVGAQSFDPELRRILGRAPVDPAPITEAAALIRGRFHLNLDLIHSIPGQTENGLRRDLAGIIELEPDHVSAYALTLEAGTPLAGQVEAGVLSLPDEDFQAEALSIVRHELETAGLCQYEISNFAHPGRECRHNLAVWAGDPYLGIGAGACSYLDGERTRNEPDVDRYLQRIRQDGDAIVERERLEARRRAGELAMLNLRTRAGLDVAEFTARSGFDPLVLFADAIRRHEQAGLLRRTAEGLRLTEAGLDLADHVFVDFIQ